MSGVARLGVVVALALCAAVPSARADEASENTLALLLRSPALRGARVGVLVEDLASGERLLEHAAAAPLVPASNQKLLIAAAALEHWGPSHRFLTPVLTEGPIVDGVLEGTLWLVGRGDPSWVSETVWRLAEELRLRGIREIRGGLAADASYFDGSYFHPDWLPVSSRAYYAPSSALAVNYSSFRIDVEPGARTGEPVRVRVAPLVGYFRTQADASTLRGAGALRLDVEVLPDGSGENVRVSGALAGGAKTATFWRAVAFPERYALAVLRAQLEAQGVKVSGANRVGRVPETALPLLEFAGEPIAWQVRMLNKFSNNFVAEQLAKGLAAELYGAPGTWQSGARALTEYATRIGVGPGRATIADGSGLSPRNRIAPEALVEVIRHAAGRFDSGPEFLASLPLGGRDGTLQTRMNGEPTPVRGKTGHLRRVASLSGVTPAGDGRALVFSVVVNGARGDSGEVDAAIDAFVAGLGRIGAAAPEPALGAN